MFLRLFLHYDRQRKKLPPIIFLIIFSLQSIMVGVAGFWGGVFSTGGIYLLMVGVVGFLTQDFLNNLSIHLPLKFDILCSFSSIYLPFLFLEHYVFRFF